MSKDVQQAREKTTQDAEKWLEVAKALLGVRYALLSLTDYEETKLLEINTNYRLHVEIGRKQVVKGVLLQARVDMYNKEFAKELQATLWELASDIETIENSLDSNIEKKRLSDIANPPLRTPLPAPRIPEPELRK